MKRYQPTPEGLARDLAAVQHVLATAIANLDRLAYADTSTETTSAGTCYDDTKRAS